MAKVLVVGGAGYVGSATVVELVRRGHEVTVLDNLSTGHPELIRGHHWVHGDLGDASLLSALFSQKKFDLVFHFAAKTIVSESVEFPDLYRENNVRKTEVLISQMLENGIRHFVFSSTCAIFGEPEGEFVHEDLPTNPLSPYGETKLEVENMLAGKFKEAGLNSIALRYFNAAGAAGDEAVGEWHIPETHLIPRVLQRALSGNKIEVFGNDYPTPDGTCIRDYVHVSDLADAHLSAMNVLLNQKTEGFFDGINLGTGQGASVLQVIREVEAVLGKVLVVETFPRRAGDAVRLVAQKKKAEKILNFFPSRTLKQIVQSAYEWESKRQKIQRKIVFFDRDGTLNPDPGYIGRPELFHFYPGATEKLKQLKAAGWTTALISNQSGVGRGYFSAKDLALVNLKMQSELSQFHACFDFISNCVHAPNQDCECRKPKPKLVSDILTKLNLSPDQAVFVGDRESDLLAAANAGISKIYLVRTGDGVMTESKLKQIKFDGPTPDSIRIVNHVQEAIEFILTSN